MSPYHLSLKFFLVAISCLFHIHFLSFLKMTEVEHDGVFVALASVIYEQVSLDKVGLKEI